MQFNIDKYLDVPYNSDINYQRAELYYLKSLPKNTQWVEDGDKIVKYFRDFLKDKTKASKEQIELIEYFANGVRKPIMELKDYYNRPRPYILAEELNIDISYVPLNSAKTPAYPSGHSTQATFLGKLCGEMFPKSKEDLQYVTNDICVSRLVARVHYPSDDVFGRYLGTEFFNQIKNKI